MVQVGNELTNGLLWPNGKRPAFGAIARFVNAGIRAVRSVSPAIRIMIHLDNGGNNAMYREWFDRYLEARARASTSWASPTIRSGTGPSRTSSTT